MFQLDVKIAFFYGDLYEEKYMSQLKGFKEPEKEQFVCKFSKLSYDLKQSPKMIQAIWSIYG